MLKDSNGKSENANKRKLLRASDARNFKKFAYCLV